MFVNWASGLIANAINAVKLHLIDSCAQYGEVADECGDAYFWCGKALLEVARQEGGILGDAVPGGVLYALYAACTYVPLLNKLHYLIFAPGFLQVRETGKSQGICVVRKRYYF